MSVFKGFHPDTRCDPEPPKPPPVGGDPLTEIPEPSEEDLLFPWRGTLEKQSQAMGIWQPRFVVLEKGCLSYFKDGRETASGIFFREDVAGVGAVLPVTLHLQVREPGGENKPVLFRVSSTEELENLVGLIKLSFDLAPDAVWSIDPAGAPSKAANTGTFGKVTKAFGFASKMAMDAGKKLVAASGQEEWISGKYRAARGSASSWLDQIEQQMDDALTSCDDGKIEMLLDSALIRGFPGDKMPSLIRRAAQRTAVRTLREATASSDPQRLKGALVAARRLQATDVPEFAIAASKYKEVRQIPEGWDMTKMVEKHKKGKLLYKPDLSENQALRALFQLMFDRTLRRVVTRDRSGASVPTRLEVVSVSEVQNEDSWADYLIRKEEVRRELASKTSKSPFMHAEADTEKALAEAIALAALPPQLARASAKAGTAMEVRSNASGERMRIFIPEGVAVGEHFTVQDCIADSLPGPPVETALNETWLFHGCRPIAAENITSGEFRVDLAGSSKGSLYGRGIYLAENSIKADEYSKPDGSRLFTMLLCRATLGQLFYSDEVSPDARRCERACSGGGFHAVLGDRRKCRGTFREFAVFDEDQVYPNYIVRYRRVLP